MSTGIKNDKSVSDAAASSARLLILWTIADVSLRLFMPVIGFTVAGYFIDKMLGTLPVGVFVGLGVGLMTAVLLVTLLYRRVTRKEKSN